MIVDAPTSSGVTVVAPFNAGSALDESELFPLVPKNLGGSGDEKTDVVSVKFENPLGPTPSPRKPASTSSPAKVFSHKLLLVDGIQKSPSHSLMCDHHNVCM